MLSKSGKQSSKSNKKSVTFEDETEEPKTEIKSIKPANKLSFEEIYKQACPDDYIRKIITDSFNARGAKYKDRISKEEGLFKGPAEEIDLSGLV